MTTKGALAIFVKTPHISPVKTRLAATIGEDLSMQFYKLSLTAIREVLIKIKNLVPDLEIYWAVAEPQGQVSELWQDFNIISQGVGGLGERLNYVYKNLVAKHSYVCFMGADSPHISVKNIMKYVQLVKRNSENRFVVGETEDGGFYFFGGSKTISENIWLNVEYSTDKTAQQLELGLRGQSGIELIPVSFDVDNYEDLVKLSNVSYDELIPEQIELIQWAKSFK